MPNRRAPLPLGESFNAFVVTGGAEDNHGRTLWRCLCACGSERLYQPSHIRAGSTKTCGCAPKQNRLTHGQSRSPTYKSWIAMRERCTRPKATKYALYGGRGIRVCDRWMASFEAFLADMGERPSGRHSIDRIDSDGNYEPSNCRWSTYSEQNRNRRSWAKAA